MRAPRLRLHDAAMRLAVEMQWLVGQLGTREAQDNLFRAQSQLALLSIREYLDILSEETGISDLSRPILPLAQALLDLESTGATPKMFDKKAMSRPPATLSEMNRKYLCAWLQRLYRNNGLGRKDSSKRLRNLLVSVFPSDMKVPSQRSLEDWFDKTTRNGEWFDVYSKLFSTDHTDTSKIVGLSMDDVDQIAKISIAQNIRNF
jgi:hypothetical protein